MPGEFRIRQTTRREVRDCPPCPTPPSCGCGGGGSPPEAGCGIALVVILVISGLITGGVRLFQSPTEAQHSAWWLYAVIFLVAAFFVGAVVNVILENAKNGT